jgi:hypothetical protein
MPQDTKNQQQGSHEQSGKNNPNQDQNSFEKKGEQGRENQPGQQTPKKDVRGEEHNKEHEKTGTRVASWIPA